MNKFENFVRENRNSFDSERPSIGLRNNILNTIIIGNKKKKRNRKIWLIAAAVATITLVNVALVGYNMAIKNSIEKSISEVAPDYKETDAFYINQITIAKNNLPKSTNVEGVKEDLNALDSMIIELKEELIIAPKNRKNELINKIISGYRTEIQILKSIKEKADKPIRLS